MIFVFRKSQHAWPYNKTPISASKSREILANLTVLAKSVLSLTTLPKAAQIFFWNFTRIFFNIRHFTHSWNHFTQVLLVVPVTNITSFLNMNKLPKGDLVFFKMLTKSAFKDTITRDTFLKKKPIHWNLSTWQVGNIQKLGWAQLADCYSLVRLALRRLAGCILFLWACRRLGRLPI